jgi:hypothetical protein
MVSVRTLQTLAIPLTPSLLAVEGKDNGPEGLVLTHPIRVAWAISAQVVLAEAPT